MKQKGFKQQLKQIMENAGFYHDAEKFLDRLINEIRQLRYTELEYLEELVFWFEKTENSFRIKISGRNGKTILEEYFDNPCYTRELFKAIQIILEEEKFEIEEIESIPKNCIKAFKIELYF